MPRQRKRLPLPEGLKLRTNEIIDEEGLMKFIGRDVFVLQSASERGYMKGELSYHHPHFQVIEGNGERHNIYPAPSGRPFFRIGLFRGSGSFISVKGQKPLYEFAESY